MRLSQLVKVLPFARALASLKSTCCGDMLRGHVAEFGAEHTEEGISRGTGGLPVWCGVDICNSAAGTVGTLFQPRRSQSGGSLRHHAAGGLRELEQS
jgi:hypothetical protein